MPRYAEVTAGVLPSISMVTGGATTYVVQTVGGVLYLVYIDSAADVSYRKSTNNGFTWAPPVQVAAMNTQNLAVWYDRWSNIAAGLIHVVYTDIDTDDTYYRTINTESSDALSTQTVIFLGGTTALNGQLAVTRARGGNVYCKTIIDAGAEGGFFRLPNANVPNGAWDAARTIDEAMATNDKIILVPGFAADNQDIMAIFWDNSSTEVSRKIYDDSANTWAETSIATGMTNPSLASYPPFAAAVDIANSRTLLVAWSNTDAANADLRCWTVTESAITEVTNVVLNSVDDQGLAAIGLSLATGYWHVFYVGKSDGSETFPTAVNVYTKVSTDAGTTWGPETVLTTTAYNYIGLWAAPRFNNVPIVMPYRTATTRDDLTFILDVIQSGAHHQMWGG